MQRVAVSLGLVFVLSSFATLNASTINNFDGGPGTPGTLEAFGDPGGASIEATGGNPGGYLRLTDAINGQNNFATKDLSDPGTYAASAFSFDFLVDGTATGPSADGFSFSYANTANFGTTGGIGAAAFTPEDPAAAGVLGFGFDTWSNEGAFDTPGIGTGSDYSEISVFYDGALVARLDDTRPSLTLDDGVWHTVTGYVDFAGGSVDLNVDGKPIFTDLAVPGLVPFESRIMFAARTGGENEIAGIDNLNVGYIVPEPATGLLALLGFGLYLLAARRRS